MKVSIIIPVYNQLKYTQKCLESIFLHGSKYEFEVIVVDNASTDGTAEYLEKFEHKIVIIKNDKNLGFAKACNQGAKIAKGEYLLFLNNDTVVTENWLNILVTEMDMDHEVGIIGPKLLYPDNTIQHAGIIFYEDKMPYHIYKGAQCDKIYTNKKREFQCLTGACLMVRREVFERVGGFEEGYINGLEDIDLCLKIKNRNLSMLYCPESVIYHFESKTAGRSNYAKENVELFFSKWKDKIFVDYKDFMLEDKIDSLEELLGPHKKGFSFKRASYLFKNFFVVARRDGFGVAVKIAVRKLR
ncbi:MAG TPA: glycosyltransferase family 2 protein [Candidatus Paceibacterota bacterium]|nr:glycosyltransferase family 2 protein [Candidatus Paceibacterota bacterium]